MIDRLHVFLDRPLHPGTARAVLALATAVFGGFAAVALVGLASGGAEGSSPAAHLAAAPATRSVSVAREGARAAGVGARGQDPQDRPGSGAARAADEELRSHRALQHVPYRQAGISIALLGARRGRALLRVRAVSLAAARRGWRAFLRRFGDDGRAYRPVFDSEKRRG